jgi:hypothetical protein
LQDFLGAIVASRSKMSFNGLRLEYALEGRSNYIAWKDRMEVVLEDNGLKGYIGIDVPKPDATDTANVDAWKKKVEKARRILLEGVRDHISQVFMGKTHHMQCGRF